MNDENETEYVGLNLIPQIHSGVRRLLESIEVETKDSVFQKLAKFISGQKINTNVDELIRRHKWLAEKNNILTKNVAMIELINLARSSNKDSLCRDLFKYFHHIKDGEHLWFVSRVAGVDYGFYYEFSRNRIRNRMNSESVADEFMKHVNEKYLFPRRVELTSSHGVGKTFRFFDQDERRGFVMEVLSIAEKLKEFSDYVCFGFGGILGAARDGKLIDHDDDLDIIVGFPPEIARDSLSAQTILVEFLRENFTFPVSIYEGSHVKMWMEKGGHDIFMGTFTNDRVHTYYGPKQGIPVSDIFPTSTIMLEGIECPAPAHVESYLEQTYGESWRIPDANFSY